MKITRQQLRRIINEASLDEFWKKKEEPRQTKTIRSFPSAYGEVGASWTSSGLVLQFTLDGKPTDLEFQFKKDIIKFRDMLDDLLAGPLDTMD